MEITEFPIVNVEKVMSLFNRKGIFPDLLAKCNSQEFKYIDGYGKGHFLTTSNVSSENLSFTVDSRTVSLKVIDRVCLDVDSSTSTKLYIYITAEPKYRLCEHTVAENYNIIIDKSIEDTEAALDIRVATSDCQPLTISEVITDFLPAGYTLSFNVASDLTCYDISIEGMSVLDALDHLCSIYGWIWTLTGVSGNIVTIWEVDTPSITMPVSGISISKQTDHISDISVNFPVYDYKGYRKWAREFYTKKDTITGPGLSLVVDDPYLPAITSTTNRTLIRNQATLDARVIVIRNNLRAILKTVRFVQKNHYQTVNISASVSPISLSEVYGDWGEGPRSIYRWIDFPYYTKPKPKLDLRLAKNWRGILAHTYYSSNPEEPIEFFVVDPQYGFDGAIPSDLQRVENIYEWDYGEEGWPVRVEWNPDLAQWEAIQQKYECPPEDAVNEAPPSSFSPWECENPY